jgi:hypothetical protein
MSQHSQPLPALEQIDLDPAALFKLFVDVGKTTQLLEIVYKSAPEVHAPDPEPATDPSALKKAQRLLLSGKVMGVQLRYLYEGAEWWDTLLRTPTGIRLVRMEQPKPPTA